MNTTIKREKFKTETGKKLFDMLLKIKDDDNFLKGVLCNLVGDEKKQKMIDILENKDYDTDDLDQLVYISIDIDRGEI
jgi:hypothetical protein